MKKIIYTSFFLLSLNTLAVTGRSEMYPDRALELMRENNFYQLSELSKESGSLQTVEIFGEKNKEVKSKGILLGTVSNFTAIPQMNAGLTVAYQKYKFEDIDKKDREYALNTHLSYRKDRLLFIGGLGYSQAKNVEKRGYSADFEAGAFSKKIDFAFDGKSNLYLYTGITSNEWKHKHSENVKFVNYRLGLTSYNYIDKFRIVGNIEANADNKKYDFNNRDKYNFSFSVATGYYIYEDLLVELKYQGTKNKKFYNNLVSLGFTHTF